MNLITKTFIANGTWTAPAGVTSVQVSANPVLNQTTQLGSNGLSLFTLDVFGNGYSCGYNYGGQLGTGNVTSYSSPVAVIGGLTFQSIVAGNFCSFGITPQGKAYAWGQNTLGQLGVGNSTVSFAASSPVAVVGGLTFQSIINSSTNSANTFYGLTTSGKCYTWGSNSGYSGTGSAALYYSSPVAIAGNLNFQTVVTNGSSTFGLTTSGALYGWGDNSFGQLGNGTVALASSPVAVVGGLTFQTLAPVFGSSFLAITPAGKAYGMGYNGNGELGVGNSVYSYSSPVAVVGNLTFQSIYNATGTFGLTTSGKLYAWGVNNSFAAPGLLGTGDIINRSSPTSVVGGLTFQSVYLSAANVFTITPSGKAYAWGDNTYGQVGSGTNTAIYSSPIAVVGSLTFSYLNPYWGSFVNGITNSGQIYSWGSNTSGQLGTNNTTSYSSPVAVTGGGFVVKSQAPVQAFTIPVVPGTAYPINLLNYNASFGNTVIGSQIASVTLSYWQ